MKIRNIIMATGFALTVSASYISGYSNGNSELEQTQSKLYEVQETMFAMNKDHLKEVNLLEEQYNKLLATKSKKLMSAIESGNVLNYNDGFVVSAYSPYDDVNGINSNGNPNSTATGTKPGPGTFAVDPDVIPYGSEITIIYEDGTVEHGIAEDTGGAIDNKRIDVFRWTYNNAMQFGMRDAVVVWSEGGN